MSLFSEPIRPIQLFNFFLHFPSLLTFGHTGIKLCSVSVTAEKLRTELANLNDADRADLAHFLISSLDPGYDADAEQAWDAELARRAEEIKSGKAVGEPAEKVFSELRQKYS